MTSQMCKFANEGVLKSPNVNFNMVYYEKKIHKKIVSESKSMNFEFSASPNGD